MQLTITVTSMFDSILSKSGLTFVEDLQLCFVKHNSIQLKVYTDARNKDFKRNSGRMLAIRLTNAILAQNAK